MPLNVIDIASWQHGLSLPVMFEENPDLHGVMVKVSQGTGYVNPDAAAWLAWLISQGKPFGTYHYLDTAGAEAEARHYVRSAAEYVGKGLLAIDYEGETLAMGTVYLKACLDEVLRLTGIRPMVYCSQSVVAAQDFGAIAAAGYPLWLAQYADMNPVSGFLDEPWQRGSVAPFPRFIMQQYTSRGHLSGWSGNLDFDKFFGSYAEWLELARGESQPVGPVKPVDPVVISEVLAGRYGIGDERIRKLAEDGYDPAEVQAKINELYGVAARVRPLVAANMEYINSIIKIVRSD